MDRHRPQVRRDRSPPPVGVNANASAAAAMHRQAPRAMSVDRRRRCSGRRCTFAFLAAALAALTGSSLFLWPRMASVSINRQVELSRCRLAAERLTSSATPLENSLNNFSCTKLFAGEAEERRRVKDFLANISQPVPCYRDEYIGCASCDELRAAFRRPFDVTEDERDFPLAYGLRVHTCATQIELLLRAIYAPHNFYCIHADAKAPPVFISAMRRIARCLPNVRLAPLDEDFVYASASQMEADLECMQVARKSSVRWRYFVNLAGQELPLKTNYELVQLLRSLNGSSHVFIERPANADRQTHSVWCKDSATNSTIPCPEPRKLKTPVPGNLTIYKSYANAEFSRAFVEYLFEKDGFARRLYDWFSDTYAPEEHYYASLLALPDTPGGVWSRTPTRAMLWYGDGECGGRFVRAICVFASADLPRLVGRAEPFVNKLHFEYDPIAVRCLVESIAEREAKARARA